MQPEKCSCSHGTSSWPIKTFPIPPLTAAGQKDGIPSPYRRNTVLHLSVNAPSTELRSELAVLVSGSDSSPVGRQLAYCHQLISPRCQLRNQHHCRICCRTVDIMHQYDVPILYLAQHGVNGPLRIPVLPVPGINGPHNGRHTHGAQHIEGCRVDISARRRIRTGDTPQTA